MATRDTTSAPVSGFGALDTPQRAIARAVMEFRYIAYSAIVSRKHAISAPVPGDQVSNMSDEDLRDIVELMRDLAHLPPA